MESRVEREVSDGDPALRTATVTTSWVGPVDDAPPELAATVERLRPTTREGERLDAVTLEIRAPEAALVRFRLAGVDGQILVRDGEATARILSSLAAYRVTVVVAGVVGFAWSTAVWAAYVGRQPTWFLSTPSAWALLLFPAVLTPLAMAVAAELSLPRLRGLRAPAALGALAVLLLAQAGFATQGSPSPEAAERQLADGAWDEARATAQACADLGIAPDRAARVLDAAATHQLAEAGSVAEAVEIIAAGFKDPAAAANATDALVERVIAEATADGARGDWTTAPALVALLPEARRTDEPVVAVLRAAALGRFEVALLEFDADAAALAEIDAATHGVPESDVATLKARADIAARRLSAPLWAAVKNPRNPSAARHEACAALVVPVRFGVVAGTGASHPTQAMVDDVCSQLRAGG